MQLLTRAALVFPALAAAAACEGDEDCYGGSCRAGACVCPPLWTGSNCEVLRLKPARAAAPGLLIKDVSTWGGQAVQSEDGEWHMFAARIVGNCGLDTWATNSELAHAVASSPEGPYVPSAAPVLGTFAHGPKVTQMSNGTLVMPHIGCGDLSTPLVTGCTNGSTPSGLPPANHSRSRCNFPGWSGVLTAASVEGPWTQLFDHRGHGLSVDGGEGAWHGSSGLTNPSVWPVGNGSTLLAYSEGCANCTLDKNGKHVGLAIGSFASGFRDLTPHEPIWPWAVEDPCIFFDSDSGYYHIIGHRTSNDGPYSSNIASHAVAKSPEGPWKIAGVQPFGRDIEWLLENGSTVVAHVQKRERPQIIVDAAGKLVGLSNGVRPGTGHVTPVSDGYSWDWTYTHVQLFDRASWTEALAV